MKFIAYAALVVVLAGCCKAECTAPELSVTFLRLKGADTDTLLLVRYNPSVGFSQPSDSMWKYTPVPPTDTSASRVAEWLDANSNWKLVLTSLNREYRISNIETKGFNCCGERARKVTAYNLNGQKILGNSFLPDK